MQPLVKWNKILGVFECSILTNFNVNIQFIEANKRDKKYNTEEKV